MDWLDKLHVTIITDFYFKTDLAYFEALIIIYIYTASQTKDYNTKFVNKFES
jgi:hypothetical protein